MAGVCVCVCVSSPTFKRRTRRAHPLRNFDKLGTLQKSPPSNIETTCTSPNTEFSMVVHPNIMRVFDSRRGFSDLQRVQWFMIWLLCGWPACFSIFYRWLVGNEEI